MHSFFTIDRYIFENNDISRDFHKCREIVRHRKKEDKNIYVHPHAQSTKRDKATGLMYILLDAKAAQLHIFKVF